VEKNKVISIFNEIAKEIEREAAKFKADDIELDEKEAIIAIGYAYGDLCSNFFNGDSENKRDALLQIATLAFIELEKIDNDLSNG